MQVSTGIRSSLGLPWVYNLLQEVVRGSGCQKELVEKYFHIKPTDKVLDFGCGPGEIIKYFPTESAVVGFDVSDKYISHARGRWGRPDRIFTTKLSTLSTLGPFDVAIAVGVLHHLDYEVARQGLETMFKNLKPGGRLVTFDPLFIDKQNWIARLLILMDRGKNVRRLEEYQRLFDIVDGKLRFFVRHDLLRFPYTIVIFEVEKK